MTRLQTDDDSMDDLITVVIFLAILFIPVLLGYTTYYLYKLYSWHPFPLLLGMLTILSTVFLIGIAIILRESIKADRLQKEKDILEAL